MLRDRSVSLAARGGLAAVLVAGSACDLGRPLGGADAAAPDGAAGAAGAAGDAIGGEAIVTIRNLAFEPAQLRVPAGTTVRWVMEDPGTFHFIVQGQPGQPASPLFSSPKLDPSDEFTFKFTEPGTYVYFCSNHSNVMRNAKVIVE